MNPDDGRVRRGDEQPFEVFGRRRSRIGREKLLFGENCRLFRHHLRVTSFSARRLFIRSFALIVFLLAGLIIIVLLNVGIVIIVVIIVISFYMTIIC